MLREFPPREFNQFPNLQNVKTMNIVIAAVGRTKEPAFRTLLDDYYGRIQRYASLTEIEIKDEKPEKILEAMDRIKNQTGRNVSFVALDVLGRSLRSEQFAHILGETADQGGSFVFALGAADGLPQSVRERATWKLSLGSMTLPHRLARVVLAEQIYRGFTILRGEPYAREN